jgi:YgiT-type zinc finger domain-containing protein
LGAKEKKIGGTIMFRVTSCIVCGQRRLEDTVIKHLERYMPEVGIVVFENIPAQRCLNCGEEYIAGEVLKKIDTILKKGIKTDKRVSIEVPAYPFEVFLAS